MAKKSIMKNYLYNLTYQILTLILPLITASYLARVLGARGNGIYIYTYTIVNYFVLFGSLGISMYGQREIAYVQNNKKKQTDVFWEIIFIKLISYIFVIFLFYILFCINGDYAIFYRILII